MAVEVDRTVDGVPELDFNPGTPMPVLGNARRVDEMRTVAPVFRSSAAQGFWVTVDGELVREVLRDAAVFSSSATIATDPDPQYLWIPQMLDPPRHTAWRHHLGPYFSPGNLRRLEESVHQRCVELLDGLATRAGAATSSATSPTATPPRSSWTCSGCPSRSSTTSCTGSTRSCT